MIKKIMFLVSSADKPRISPDNKTIGKDRGIIFLVQKVVFRQQDKYGRTEYKGRGFNKE
jgi:hypothetical protein